MSFWISYATDILIEQQPYESSADHSPDLYPLREQHSFATSCSSTTQSLSQWVQELPRYIPSLPTPQDHKPLTSSCATASPKDKVLYFGSSCASQLPKRAQTTTASPWNLFTHKQSSPSIRNFFHQLRSLERTYNKESSTPSRSPSRSTPSKSLSTSSFKPLHTSSSQKPTSSARKSEPDTPPSIGLFEAKKTQPKVPSKTTTTTKDQSTNQDQQQQQQHPFQHYKQQLSAKQVVPTLIPPTLGIFSLSYLLTKQGILADFAAYSTFKENLESSQKELALCHEERIDIIKRSMAKQAQKKTWKTFTRILEWALSWLNVAIATTAVFTGGGLFAVGALVASIIVLLINIIDELDGWKTLVKHLPGKHTEKKLKLLGIIKFALLTISCVLSLRAAQVEDLPVSAVIQGAFKAIPPALEGGVALLRGTMIGLQSRLLKVKESLLHVTTKIDIHNWERSDTLSHTEELLSNLEDNFDHIARILELHYETTRSTIHCFR